MECKYEGCKEEIFEEGRCILHVNLLENEESAEFKRINKLKEEKVKEKVNNGDFNFEGVKLTSIDLSNWEVNGNLNFNRAKIKDDAIFIGSKIGVNALFNEIKINEILI